MPCPCLEGGAVSAHLLGLLDGITHQTDVTHSLGHRKSAEMLLLLSHTVPPDVFSPSYRDDDHDGESGSGLRFPEEPEEEKGEGGDSERKERCGKGRYGSVWETRAADKGKRLQRKEAGSRKGGSELGVWETCAVWPWE